MKITIALDAMGGDALAIPNIHGAYLALNKGLSGGEPLKVILCGQLEEIHKASRELAEEDDATRADYRFDPEGFQSFIDDGRIEIVDCDEVVGMDESPATVVRQKRNSSMGKIFELVRDGKADAAISAGNSGAMMAYGISILKRLPRVKRPAIIAHFPTKHGVTSLLDAGANVDCTPQQLEQFAEMGKIYFESVFEVKKPRIALLNIGEEEGKGNELVKETSKLLRESMPENYAGFIEGRDILDGSVEVIVCDGFVGNVALKTAEGVAKAVRSILKEEFSRNAIWGLGAWLAKGGFTAMSTKFDYREYGAAPLIGLNGLGLISHGSSDAKAMQNAIRIGALYVRQGLMKKLSDSFSSREKELEKEKVSS